MVCFRFKHNFIDFVSVHLEEFTVGNFVKVFPFVTFNTSSDP